MNSLKFLLGTFSLFVLVVTPQAYAQNSARFIAGPIPVEVLRVIDGDTIEVAVRPWLSMEITTSVRLRGIDAPETYKPKCDQEKNLGTRATEFVKRLVETENGGSIILSEIEPDKYNGRVVAYISTAKGDNIGSILMSQGMAVEYDGKGPRHSWCS